MINMSNRRGESGSVPDRHARFIEKDSYWYYTTREGIDIGPFDNREDAIQGVTEFIEYICEADPKVREALLQYKPNKAA